MIYVPRSDEEHKALSDWLSGKMNTELWPCRVMAVVRGDQLLAACAYNNLIVDQGIACDIQGTIYATSPKWATPEAIREFLRYPFHEVEVRRFTAITHQKNKRVHRFLKGIGFLKEGRIHDRFPDGDAFVFGMTRRFYLRSKWASKERAAKISDPS